MGINKATLIGHLGRDPEMKYGQTSGTAVTRFSLATSERRNNEPQTEWHKVVCFGQTAEFANEYLTKGRQVYVEGRIQTRKWQDKQGHDRYTTEIIANTVQALGPNPSKANETGASGNEHPHGATSYAANEKQAAPARRNNDDPFSGDFGPPPTDDDMPF